MQKSLFSLLFAALMLSVFVTDAQRITVTVAGNGFAGYTGDNGPAKRASLMYPYDVCTDAARNLYFTDQNKRRIRKLTAATGAVTTIAGGGTSYMDGVPATDVSIIANHIWSDPAGNIYISAPGRILRISAASGIITTVAGGGSGDFDGVPATSVALGAVGGVCLSDIGEMFFITGHRIRKVDASGIITTIAGAVTSGASGDGGPATAALLNAPNYIACDHAGNLYFSDQGSWGVIRRIDAVTGIITTPLGNITNVHSGALFNCSGADCMVGGVSGICCDDSGDVIFNEWSCSCREWHPGTDWVSPVAGNFYTESFNNDTSSDFAWMNYNYGICADADFNYYIADSHNDRIRKVIQLTDKPVFAFGQAQSAVTCAGTSLSLDGLLWVADKTVGQTETWSLLAPPATGTVAGFPTTAISGDTRLTAKPVGLSYIPAAGYTGADSMQVLVSDGTAADTITIYIMVNPPVTMSGPSAVCLSSSVTLVPSAPDGTWSTAAAYASVTGGVVTGLTPGVDTVFYIVDIGCGPATIAWPVSVDTDPVAGDISGYINVCQGAAITLSATGTGGVWSVTGATASVSPTGELTGLAAGMATILYTVTNACGTDVASYEVEILPAANAGTITGSSSVCLNAAEAMTTSVPAGSGSWGIANGHATITGTGIVTGVTPGTDTVLYIVSNECGTAYARKEITVTDCETSFDLPVIVSSPAVSVYPVPAADVVHITATGISAPAQVRITDATGRTVLGNLSLSAPSFSAQVSVGALQPGIYMVSLTGDNLNVVKSLVVTH